MCTEAEGWVSQMIWGGRTILIAIEESKVSKTKRKSLLKWVMRREIRYDFHLFFARSLSLKWKAASSHQCCWESSYRQVVLSAMFMLKPSRMKWVPAVKGPKVLPDSDQASNFLGFKDIALLFVVCKCNRLEEQLLALKFQIKYKSCIKTVLEWF